MKKMVIDKLSSKYTLEKRDMSDLSHIKSAVSTFDCDAYTTKGIGNLFFINMNSIFSLMKMESTVITPIYKDLSFGNFDIVDVMNRQTMIFEIFQSSINKNDLSSYKTISDKYSYLNNHELSSSWYDELKLISLSKKGKNIRSDGMMMLEECVDLYIELLDKAENCDPEMKKQEIRKYVDRLLNEGGIAVDAMKKMIDGARAFHHVEVISIVIGIESYSADRTSDTIIIQSNILREPSD